ncbi:hypothetical protein ACRS6B_01970 [Nocardia asteroides]
MWEWGRAFAGYAAATAWTRTTEPEPKYGEPEYWAEPAGADRGGAEPAGAELAGADRGGADRGGGGDSVDVAARDPIVSEYDLAG